MGETEHQQKPVRLAVSVVSYRPQLKVLLDTLSSLSLAITFAVDAGLLDNTHFYLVDNEYPGSSSIDQRVLALCRNVLGEQVLFECIAGHGNLGYGRGHNLAIERSDCEFHLVLNPDVVLANDAIAEALIYLNVNDKVGMLSPSSRDKGGKTEYLCKRYPSVANLLLRGFAPDFVKHRFDARLAEYECRDATDAGHPFDACIVSGCFMFARTAILKSVGGFSANFFMYFEDFDLSLRLARISGIRHVPAVRIVHLGGGASRKGMKHVLMFARSALTFYKQHGFKFL